MSSLFRRIGCVCCGEPRDSKRVDGNGTSSSSFQSDIRPKIKRDRSASDVNQELFVAAEEHLLEEIPDQMAIPDAIEFARAREKVPTAHRLLQGISFQQQTLCENARLNNNSIQDNPNATYLVMDVDGTMAFWALRAPVTKIQIRPYVVEFLVAIKRDLAPHNVHIAVVTGGATTNWAPILTEIERQAGEELFSFVVDIDTKEAFKANHFRECVKDLNVMGLSRGVLVDDRCGQTHNAKNTTNDTATQLVTIDEYKGGDNSVFWRDPEFKLGGKKDKEIRRKLEHHYSSCSPKAATPPAKLILEAAFPKESKEEITDPDEIREGMYVEVLSGPDEGSHGRVLKVVEERSGTKRWRVQMDDRRTTWVDSLKAIKGRPTVDFTEWTASDLERAVSPITPATPSTERPQRLYTTSRTAELAMSPAESDLSWGRSRSSRVPGFNSVYRVDDGQTSQIIAVTPEPPPLEKRSSMRDSIRNYTQRPTPYLNKLPKVAETKVELAPAQKTSGKPKGSAFREGPTPYMSRLANATGRTQEATTESGLLQVVEVVGGRYDACTATVLKVVGDGTSKRWRVQLHEEGTTTWVDDIKSC